LDSLGRATEVLSDPGMGLPLSEEGINQPGPPLPVELEPLLAMQRVGKPCQELRLKALGETRLVNRLPIRISPPSRSEKS
jgi:hypothetical protein